MWVGRARPRWFHGGRGRVALPALVVLGRDDLVARAFLPLVDEGAKNGESRFVELLGWKDDETVLARVVPEDGSSENWYVVARHWPSGRLEHLTGGDAYARLSDVVPALVE